ncbi:MAG: putative bifunctional diguanylate cyclase/phosphodiesterase [Vicinamibacterales bacterium]
MRSLKGWAPQLAAFRRRLPPGATVDLDEDRARAIRARQIQAVLKMSPAAMAANVANACLVCGAFWSTAPRSWLLAWAGVIFLAAWRGAVSWLRARRRGPVDGASAHGIRRAERHAAWLALLWGVVPIALFASASPPQQVLLATLTTGMIGGGGFALASVPTAGTLYVILLGLAGAAAIVQWGVPLAGIIGALLVIYCVTVIWAVWMTANVFTARLMAEADAARQHEVIGLLLRDFEESASDVLWEADREGRLVAASSRLAQMFGLPEAVLLSAPLPTLLQRATPDLEDGATRVTVLRERFADATPFRDQTVSGVRAGETRWWSLSAKPHFDRAGLHLGWRGVVSDITDTYTADERLKWLAHNDSLTGLGNRHQFRTRLGALLAAPQEPGRSVAVIYADLDHFKAINDTLGHAVGDAVLRVIGRRMLNTARRTDVVARLGGDEFAVLVPGVTKIEEVEHLCRRMLTSVTEPCEVNGLRHRVRCSMGVAIGPRDGEDVDALLSHADLALYAAKSAGRNEVRFFTPDMALNTRRRVAIEEGLRDAVTRGQFHLVFQPMVSLQDEGRVLGFEALLRWHHPLLGDVAPSEFIAIAEESGQMVPIGRFVLETACLEAASWSAALTVAVNVSPVQASSPELLADVRQALSVSGLDASRLELEITESALLSQTESTARVMHHLCNLGCRIALDDFGTGYSALSYLRQFPFHALKIDRSLIAGLAHRSDAQAIVRMIVGLAQTLELETVAEGVDDASQVEVLRRHGCNAGQGYVLGEPMPSASVPSFLRRATIPARHEKGV